MYFFGCLHYKSNWNKYKNKIVFTANNNFKDDFLLDFSKKYEFVGRTDINEYLKMLELFFSMHPNTHLTLILGSEIPYLANTQRNYINREKEHLVFNKKIFEYANNHNKLHIINITDFIESQDDFLNNINHFTPQIYYRIANAIIGIAEKYCNQDVKIKSKILIYIYSIKNFIKLRFSNNPFCYKILKNVYGIIRK